MESDVHLHLPNFYTRLVKCSTSSHLIWSGSRVCVWAQVCVWSQSDLFSPSLFSLFIPRRSERWQQLLSPSKLLFPRLSFPSSLSVLSFYPLVAFLAEPEAPGGHRPPPSCQWTLLTSEGRSVRSPSQRGFHIPDGPLRCERLSLCGGKLYFLNQHPTLLFKQNFIFQGFKNRVMDDATSIKLWLTWNFSGKAFKENHKVLAAKP